MHLSCALGTVLEQILEMVRRGETPPGIRDINDKPPNPNQPLSASQLAPRAKVRGLDGNLGLPANNRVVELKAGFSREK